MGRVTERVQEFLLAEAAERRYPVLREVAARLKVNIMTAQKARAELVQAGRLPEPLRSYRHRKERRASGRPPVVKSGAEIRTASVLEPVTRAPVDAEGAIPKPLPPSLSENDLLLGATSPALTTDEQRQRLSWLADNAQREEVRLSAISALARIDSMSGGQSTARKFDPLNEEDRVYHLSLLMKAVGKHGTERAFAVAFN